MLSSQLERTIAQAGVIQKQLEHLNIQSVVETFNTLTQQAASLSQQATAINESLLAAGNITERLAILEGRNLFPKPVMIFGVDTGTPVNITTPIRLTIGRAQGSLISWDVASSTGTIRADTYPRMFRLMATFAVVPSPQEYAIMVFGWYDVDKGPLANTLKITADYPGRYESGGDLVIAHVLLLPYETVSIQLRLIAGPPVVVVSPYFYAAIEMIQ